MRLVYLFTLFSTSLIIHSQTIRQEFIIGGMNDDYPASIIESNDKGFVIAGSTNSFGSGGTDCYFTKLDSNGVLAWSKAIGGVHNDVSSTVLQTNDLGYILAGNTKSFGDTTNGSIYLIKTDVNGSIQWTKALGSNISATSIAQTQDNGFIITGYISLNSLVQHIHLTKVDQTGNIVWSKIFSNGAWNATVSVINTKDGGYAMSGTVDGGAQSLDLLIIKTDSLGNIQFSKEVGGPAQEQLGKICQTSDKGFVIAGVGRSYGVCCNYDVYIVKLDSLGSVKWSKTVGGNGAEYSNTDVIENHKKEIIVASHTASFGAGGDMYLIKFDSIGTFKGAKAIGKSNYEDSRSIFQTKDKGYLLAGLTNSFGNDYDIYVLKLDSNLTTTCADTISGGTVKLGATITNVTYSVSIGTLTFTTGAIVINGGTSFDPCLLNSLTEVQNSIFFQIVPNPFQNKLTVILENNNQFKIEVYNVLGSMIFSVNSENKKTEVDLNNLQNGIYFIKVGPTIKKIIKN